MADNRVRVWREDVVFGEKGNRVWHYTLFDKFRNSLLAVVATEKADRHISYSVSAEFLRAFGSTRAVNVKTTWTRKKEAVNWIISLARIKAPIFPVSSHRVIGKTPSLECIKSSTALLSSRKHPTDDEGSNKTMLTNSEIIWSGEAWICKKQLKHYSSFSRRGINVDVYSFVYVMGEHEREYLAYVQDLYEDQNHRKMVKVRWFNFPKDIEDLTVDIETHAREVFITRHIQDISAECVNGLATVLTPSHFDICSKFIPDSVHLETFMCHGQVLTKKIIYFYLSQLHGYSLQPIISSLVKNQQYLEYLVELEEGEGEVEVEGQREGGAKPGKEPLHCQTFNVNDKIEILRQNSGLRGCWFTCEILRVSQLLLRVQYRDVIDDEYQNLKEYVPSHIVADQDELDMRHDGRLTIRPLPFEAKFDSSELNVGAAVDVWWCNGWWEGVVIGNETSSFNNLQLFFPGEKKFLTIERKNVRASKDWIDGKWMSIKPNPSILASINSILNPIPQPSPPPVMNGTNNSLLMDSDALNLHQEPRDSSASSSAAVIPNAASELHYKKRLIIRYEGERAFKKFINCAATV